CRRSLCAAIRPSPPPERPSIPGEPLMRAYALLLTASLTALPTVLCAASLQVAPVNIEVQAPAAAATLRLHNVGTRPLNAQLRVFRWSQENGEEKLEPTD